MKNLPENTTLSTLLSERRNDVQQVNQLEKTRLVGRNMTKRRGEPTTLQDDDAVGDMWYGSDHLYICAELSDGTRKWKKINWADA
jgi:hypothetical protein